CLCRRASCVDPPVGGLSILRIYRARLCAQPAIRARLDERARCDPPVGLYSCRRSGSPAPPCVVQRVRSATSQRSANCLRLSLPRVRRHLWSELVCDAELEKVLHHRQLIRDDQGATTGRRTTGTDARVRSAEGIEVAREIPEIGETILGTSYPTGPEQQGFSADAGRPADLSSRVFDFNRTESSGEVVAGGAV